jgi:hypothetical protein
VYRSFCKSAQHKVAIELRIAKVDFEPESGSRRLLFFHVIDFSNAKLNSNAIASWTKN